MAEEVPQTMNKQALKRLSSDLENQDSREHKRGKGSFLKMQGSVSSSEPQCTTVVLALPVPTEEQRSRSRSGTVKCTKGGDVEPETLQQKWPLLPDLNEEYCEP